MNKRGATIQSQWNAARHTIYEAIARRAAHAALLGAVIVIFAATLPGQSRASGQGLQQRLEFALIVSRHGVRSPLAANTRLDPYSAIPWPRWDVAPGELTAHGYELLVSFGAYDRRWFTEDGLLPAAGCVDRLVSIDADSDQRTVASGEALAEGLSHGCHLKVHARPQGELDTLFHPDASPAGAEAREGALESLRKGLNGDPNSVSSVNRRLLDEMQEVLDGCSIVTACSSELPPPAKQLLEIPATLKPGNYAHLFEMHGPLATGSSFAEDFLMEYANGDSMSSVGWGRLDEEHIRRLLGLHTAYFSLTHRTPFVAQVEASNLLERILRTLNQEITGERAIGTLGDPGKRVVILVGHDTNLAALAALLQLHWTVDGRADDTPPGAELQFLVFRDERGHASIRLRYMVQTLTQMRNLQSLSRRNPPAQLDLVVPGCPPAGGLCAWSDFRHVAESAINPAFIEGH